MLNRLEITCFRKVLHEVLTFTPGVNALRGPNEAGKSTRLEAIGYALVGAKFLTEPLEDVVTYGHAERELKVVLTFTVNGTVYTIKRSKAGADLTHGVDRVVGQTEVTKFVENLLGCNAAMLSKLMFAKQSMVTAALEEGAAGTVKLIETIANFDLITTLIDLVQTKLPTGNEAATEGLIVHLAEALVEPVKATGDVEAKLAVSEAQVAELTLAVAEATSATIDPMPIARAIQQDKQARANLDELQVTLAGVNKELAEPIPEFTEQDEAKLLAVVDELSAAAEVSRAVRLLRGLPVVPCLEQSETEVKAEYAQLNSELALAQIATNKLLLDRRTLEGMVIKETSCAFCGKDFKDVPEVAYKNSELGLKLAALTTEHEVLMTKIGQLQGKVRELSSYLASSANVRMQYAAASQYLDVQEVSTPPKYIWKGPVQEVDTLSLTAQKLVLEQRKAAKIRSRDRKLYLEHTKLSLVANRNTQQSLLCVGGLEEQLEAANLSITKLAKAKSELAAAREVRTMLSSQLDMETRIFDQAFARFLRDKAQLEDAQANLAALRKNNILLKKLRLARPAIADQVWTMVLSTVSSYFSAIRGTPSVVTRTDEGFRINGRPVLGMSGSTKDALGLSIRIALTRTFLPNASFLILDEVAAGMDATREAAMLGFVAGCGMPQVLLVTHSELADSFASNVIAI